jgi:hypothetical protein
MKKHEILSPQSRAALFDPPTDPTAIVRRYTFSPEDSALIRQRRRAANRIGFAIQRILSPSGSDHARRRGSARKHAVSSPGRLMLTQETFAIMRAALKPDASISPNCKSA